MPESHFVRRSTRERHAPILQYEGELKAMAEKKRVAQDSDFSEGETDAEDLVGLEDGDDDDGEEFGRPKKKKAKKSKSPQKANSKKATKKSSSAAASSTTTTAKAAAAGGAKRKIQLKLNFAGKRTKQIASNTTNNNNNKKTRPGIHKALTTVAKRILDEQTETPETSLVAALLASSKPIPGITSVPPRDVTAILEKKTSMYTPQIEGIARKLLQDHSESNSLHIQLLNLLFRSVGGSVENNFQPGTDLEELTDDEWDELMTDVVEVMREGGEDPLLTANLPTTIVGQEYRKIYNEFWYRLGNVILNHNAAAVAHNLMTQDSLLLDGSSKDDNNSNNPNMEFSSNRFQVEMIRDLIARLSELVMVGQPDLRAASTMAIWQLSIACVRRTVELEHKLLIATRQSRTSGGKSNKKYQAVKHSIDAWKRNKAELEEIIEASTFQGVFIHRYRDSNPQIRAESLQVLSKLCILRPDLFLRDKYLKYFGWMASDKVAKVRVAALEGLLAPFREEDNEKLGGPPSLSIDLSNMQNVCTKFLSRIVDCTEDAGDMENNTATATNSSGGGGGGGGPAQGLRVQELAMELLLAMLHKEFLDDWEDDDGWDQINLKALDARTTPKVRRDALYFILEQLPSFDTEDDGRSSRMSGHGGIGDKKQVERIEGIAMWVANKLADGPIPIDKIRVHLTDLIVHSLREMPEHRHLVLNWSAMLKAIRSENPQQGRTAGREEVAKQRVLLRMLATAAELEVGAATNNNSKSNTNDKNKKRSNRDDESTLENQESLSLELLKNLPLLLPAFKGDIIALRSLTQLPKYLMSSVYSLPARKGDFSTLIQSLSRLFLETTDEIVLKNISQVLAVLVEGDHTRVAEVRLQLKRLSRELHNRLMELLGEEDPDNASKSTRSPARRPARRRTRSPRSSSTKSTDGSGTTLSSGPGLSSPEADVQHSVYLCLMRWRMLLKSCPLSFLFEKADSSNDDDNEEDEDEAVEGFFNTITEAMGKKLVDRKPVEDDGADSRTEGALSVIIPDIWALAEPDVHGEVARAVDEALQVLLCVIAWKLLEALKKSTGNLASAKEEGEEMEAALVSDVIEPDDLLVLRMRNRLVNLLGLCFEQYLPEPPNGMEYAIEHEEFSISVQASAGRVASDTRVLFPREWVKAKDPVRKALALTNDSELIGGFGRYFLSREPELFELAEKKDSDSNANELVSTLLLPLARALTANWNDSNRQEVAMTLAHITGSGLEAAHLVHGMARLLKKINPVRFVEAQMVCLQMSFDDWVKNEPFELSTDRPTEEELQEYENDVKNHQKLFQAIEHRASRLSQCLGVGRLTDPRLKQSMLNFMQEGVRFAFEGSRNSEDELVLGSYLVFLSILGKYSVWIKKEKEQLDVLRKSIYDREDAMRAHPEFGEVHQDDLAALNAFKESLGISFKRKQAPKKTSKGASKARDDQSVEGDDNDDADDDNNDDDDEHNEEDDNEEDDKSSVAATPSPAKRRSAGAKRKISTVGSHRSRMSTQSNLSPLYEEDATAEGGEDDDDDNDSGSPSPQKRRRLHRGNSPESDEKMTDVGNVGEMIEEEEEEEDEGHNSEGSEES